MGQKQADLSNKLELIFWPFLRLLGLFLGLYGLVDGALLRWLPTFEPHEELRRVLVPLVLAVVVVPLGLWPRLRLLREGEGRRDPRALLVMLAVPILGFGATFVHNLVVAGTGRLAKLDSPAAFFPDRPPAHYYTFRRLHQSPHYVGVEPRVSKDGKGNKLHFHLYVVTPMLASLADTLRSATVWRALHYYDQVSLDASETERQAAFHAFMLRSQTRFEQVDAGRVDFAYFRRLPNNDDRAAYLRAVRRSVLRPDDATQPLLILEPGEGAFDVRAHKPTTWLLGWLTASSLLFLLLLAAFPLDPDAVETFREGRHARLPWVPFWLMPAPGYALTPALVVANGGFYILMALVTRSGIGSFAPSDLLAWGGSYGPAIADGAWWRLLSGLFVHNGIWHIVNSMVALVLLGAVLEKPLGTVRFVALYVLAGVGGNLAGLLWHPGAVAVGASGAVFGLMGAALVLLWRRALPDKLRGGLLALVAALGGVSLLMGWLMPGIDNAAHLGGLLVGMLIGLILSPGLRRGLPYYEASGNSGSIL